MLWTFSKFNKFAINLSSTQTQLCLSLSIPYSAAIIMKSYRTIDELIYARYAKFSGNRIIVKINKASTCFYLCKELSSLIEKPIQH